MIDPRVEKLLKRPQPEQRTPEWFEARKTRITASSVSSLLTRNETVCKKYVELYGLHEEFLFDSKKCCNPYSSKEEFIMSKIKQTFQGSPATFWGQKYEPIATQIYEKHNDTVVIEFGLLTHEKLPWLAASPDGITESGVMLEIKCPYRRKITGIPPLYYYQQVQIQLEVAGLDVCDFLEIEFSEFASMDEFLDDTLQDNPVDYKGLFLQIETTPDEFETREYIYPPRELINDPVNLNIWRQDQMMKIVDEKKFAVEKETKNCIVVSDSRYRKFLIRTVYWKTEVVSIVSIARDVDWFESVKDYLYREWNSVLEAKHAYTGEPRTDEQKVITVSDCMF